MLRKENGWSQEELAGKLEISRQSVSKWESGSSLPDLNRILQLARLFGVTTDFLLKDEEERPLRSGKIQEEESVGKEESGREEENLTENPEEEEEKCRGADEDRECRSVTFQETLEYLEKTGEYARCLGRGVMLCIFAPAALMVTLGTAAWLFPGDSRAEDAGAVLGIAVMLGIVAWAVAVLFGNSERMKPYVFLREKRFRLEPGVEEAVMEEQVNFENSYRKAMTLGIGLCIVSMIPLLITGMLETVQEALPMFGLTLLFLLTGLGVNLIVTAWTIRQAQNELLSPEMWNEKTEKRVKKKKSRNGIRKYEDSYWICVVAVYFLVSFYTGNWGYTWLMFLAAAAVWEFLEATAKE